MIPVGHKRLIIGVYQFEDLCKTALRSRNLPATSQALFAQVYILFTELIKLKFMFDNYRDVEKEVKEFYINGEPLSLLIAARYALHSFMQITDSGILTIVRARNNVVHDILNNRERQLLCCNVMYMNRVGFLKFYKGVISCLNLEDYTIKSSYFPYVLGYVVRLMKSNDKNNINARVLCNTDIKLEKAVEWLRGCI